MKGIIIKLKEIVRKGFLYILFGNTLNKIILFVSSVVIIRLIDKVDYANLVYTDNLYSYIGLFAGLGMASALLKFCSPTIDKEEDKYFFVFALKYGAIFQLILTLILVVYITIINIPFPDARGLIYAMILFPLLSYVMTVMQSYSRSHMQNRLFAKMGFIQTFAAFILSVLLTVLIGVYGIVIARYIAIILAILVGFSFIKKQMSTIRIASVSTQKRNAFLKMSVSLMLANMFSMMMPINEMFLVSQIIQDEEITASYKVAILIPSQLLIIVNSIIIFVFPLVSQVSDDRLKAFKKIKNIGLITAVVIILFSIIGMLLNPLIIKVLYGESYISALELSNIFWLIYAINAGFRMIPLNMLPALGKTSFNVVISILSCVIHVVLDYFFILKFGIFGVAFATGIVYVLSGILYWVYLYFVCHSKLVRP